MVPTIGSTDWADTMRVQTFLAIAQHQHTGSGDGSKLGTGSISDDAITGAKIRLDNDEYLKARNAADSANINLIKADTNDDAYIEAEIANLVMKQNTYLLGRNAADSANINLIKVDASDKLALGADLANLAIINDTFLTGRNNADSAYIDIAKVNTSDKIALGADLANAALINNVALQHRNAADSAYVDTIKLNASDKIELGAELTAVSILNNVAVQHRNAADSAYIDTIKVNASDKIELGANVVSANVETLGTSLIDTLDSAVTLADNQSATSAGIVTLGTDESCSVHYRIVRNGVTQSGVLRFTDVATIPSEQFSGTSVGVTFTVSAGALQYATTSTGNAGSMTYVVIKE